MEIENKYLKIHPSANNIERLGLKLIIKWIRSTLLNGSYLMKLLRHWHTGENIDYEVSQLHLALLHYFDSILDLSIF